jgi:hypothetical protein
VSPVELTDGRGRGKEKGVGDEPNLTTERSPALYKSFNTLCRITKFFYLPHKENTDSIVTRHHAVLADDGESGGANSNDVKKWGFSCTYFYSIVSVLLVKP